MGLDLAAGNSIAGNRPHHSGVSLARQITGVISIIGVAALIWAGIQPPNALALPVTAGLAVLLTLSWHLGIKKSFQGPPSVLIKGPATEIPITESVEIDPA